MVPNPLTVTKNTMSAGLDTISRYAEAVDHRSRALPGARDADDGHRDEPHSAVAKAIAEFRAQVKKGNPFTMDATSISALLDAIQHSDALDDRKLLLEHVLVLMSRLPEKSHMSKSLSDKVIAMLYNDLPHPPATYISNTYVWRSADGSNNNPLAPDLGKAGTAYSRSVQQQTPLPVSELPDPGLIFDCLLRRTHFTPHPSGVSSMMFGFATLVIHSIFRTSHTDWTINETSSYLDLAPLYGHNQAGQDLVRDKKGGRGLLWNDVFAEDRMLFLPPVASTLLVMFNRNHNWIARKLLEINERGTWSDPPPEDTAKRLAQDDAIFNTARLINCGWFAAITFGDYVSAILGLVRDGSSWSLLPFDEIRKQDRSIVERGKGNACSVEFNLLYRWHATTSAEDEKWTEDRFREAFGGKPFDEITVRDFAKVSDKLKEVNKKDIRTWEFSGLKRGPDGKFKDDDLAKILLDATAHSASAFGAHKTPGVMRTVEIMTMQMARKWGVCTLNEFRKSLGLKPYTTFEEWNPDPAVWQVAQRLYEHPDRLELFPGLQAEETKVPGPGAGLCPGMTTSRAILADAVALTRGDRFFTTDFTPWNLTAFGYKDCTRDGANPGFGGALGLLLLRALPKNYTEKSTFTWFPLQTPAAIQKSLANLSLSDRYDFSRPTPGSSVTSIASYKDVKAIIESSSSAFACRYGRRARTLLKGGGYLPSLNDGSALSLHSKIIRKALIEGPSSTANILGFWNETTRQLVNFNSFTLVGTSTRTVDIVRDVVNLVPIHWVCFHVAGIPLKTHDHLRGIYFEQQMDDMIKTIYGHIFLDIDPAKAMRLEEAAQKYTNIILGEIKAHVARISSRRLSISGVAGSIWEYFFGSGLPPACFAFMEKLYAAGLSDEEMANNIFSIIVTTTVEISQSIIHVVNYYLGEAGAPYLAALKQTACANDGASLASLESYAKEALRLDPVIPGVYRDVSVDAGSLSVKKGESVYLSLANANKDESVFAKAQSCDPRRPTETPPIIGDPLTKSLGDDFMFKVMAQVLKVIFSLKNIRRAPGASGQLRRHAHSEHGTNQYLYLDVDQNLSTWPTSTLVQFEV